MSFMSCILPDDAILQVDLEGRLLDLCGKPTRWYACDVVVPLDRTAALPLFMDSRPGDRCGMADPTIDGDTTYYMSVLLIRKGRMVEERKLGYMLGD